MNRTVRDSLRIYTPQELHEQGMLEKIKWHRDLREPDHVDICYIAQHINNLVFPGEQITLLPVGERRVKAMSEGYGQVLMFVSAKEEESHLHWQAIAQRGQHNTDDHGEDAFEYVYVSKQRYETRYDAILDLVAQGYRYILP